MKQKEIEFTQNVEEFQAHRQTILQWQEDFSSTCKLVKDKLVKALETRFSKTEGWHVKPLSEYIQVRKVSWKKGVHFELLTNRHKANIQDRITFDSLISNGSVAISFELHAEEGCSQIRKEFETAFNLGKKGRAAEEKYKFNNGENCRCSIEEIVTKQDEIISAKLSEVENILKKY